MSAKGPRTLNAARHLRKLLTTQGFKVTQPVDKSIERLHVHQIWVELEHPVENRSDLKINREKVHTTLQILAALHALKHKTDLMPTHEHNRVAFAAERL